MRILDEKHSRLSLTVRKFPRLAATRSPRCTLAMEHHKVQDIRQPIMIACGVPGGITTIHRVDDN